MDHRPVDERFEPADLELTNAHDVPGTGRAGLNVSSQHATYRHNWRLGVYVGWRRAARAESWLLTRTEERAEDQVLRIPLVQRCPKRKVCFWQPP
jgi:hypothetical protein